MKPTLLSHPSLFDLNPDAVVVRTFPVRAGKTEELRRAQVGHGFTRGGVGFSNAGTSKEAALSLDAKNMGRVEGIIYNSIVAMGVGGMTCDELEQTTGLPHTTCSARIYDLKRTDRPGGPKIVASGLKRPTRSGRHAAVWIAA